MDMRFRIFVVFHDVIHPEYYQGDFKDCLTFVNVNPYNENVDQLRKHGYNIINQYEFENFNSLGKQFAESEVIYNIFKNQYLISDVEFVGFIQYDMHTHSLSQNEINSLIDSFWHIAFDQHSLQSDYKVGFLMDERRPNKWIGRGKNCYLSILDDYNKFYQSRYSMDDLLPRRINLCCAFLLQKEYYNEMMCFISHIIESKKLEVFDTQNVFRMQGGLLERYFGIWLTINSLDYFHRPVEHIFNTTTTGKEKGLANRIMSFIKRKLL